MKLGMQLLLDLTGLGSESSVVSTDKKPLLQPSPITERYRFKHGPDSGLTELAQNLIRQLRGHKPLADYVSVVWNPRLQSTAGCANPKTWEVELNPRLKELGTSVIHRILKHELAHLVSVYRAGRKKIDAHGPEWRQACADLGIPNEQRCHSLPLPARQVKYKHAYRCRGCGTVLKRVRPLPRYSACFECCHKHTDGKYDDRYRFDRITLEAAP